jgi:hypothetical protein
MTLECRARHLVGRFALVVAAALAPSVAACSVAHAQEPLRPYPELRGDVFVAPTNSALLGVGEQFPLGYYTRFGLDVSGGVAWKDDATFATARVDALMRFLLDPFREKKWALSAGAGVAVRYVAPDEWRPFLAIVLDVEGKRTGPITPAFQLGLGGGMRLGVVVRGSRRAYR